VFWLILNNNILIPSGAVTRQEEKARGAADLAGVAAGGLGVVYIFNCSSIPITSIMLGNASLSQLPGEGSPEQPSRPVAMNRYGPPPLFVSPVIFNLTFIDETSYGQTIQFTQPAVASLSLWCYYTGFVLTDAYGAILQLSW
jgi:hypothetical protein